MAATLRLISLLGLLAASASPSAQPTTLPAGRVADNIELRDANGVICRPLLHAKESGEKAAVFIFIAIDCPISNGYAPEINRIVAQFHGSFDFYLVHADPDLSAADAKKHAADFGYACRVLLDPGKVMAGKLGASATPEAFIIALDGSTLYRGRIDDRYAQLGKRREVTTSHDLRDALEAVKGGKPVVVAETAVVGCPI